MKKKKKKGEVKNITTEFKDLCIMRRDGNVILKAFALKKLTINISQVHLKKKNFSYNNMLNVSAM